MKTSDELRDETAILCGQRSVRANMGANMKSAILAVLIGCAAPSPLTADASAPLAAPSCARVFLLGDSTTRNTNPGAYGYGDALPYIVNVPVQNWGVSGATSSTYLTVSAWRSVTSLITASDCVVISFGINDRATSTPPATYASNMQAMQNFVMSKGARPIVVGPIALRASNELLAPFTVGVDFDLNAATFSAFAGRSDVYQPDGIHLTATGAMVVAEIVRGQL